MSWRELGSTLGKIRVSFPVNVRPPVGVELDPRSLASLDERQIQFAYPHPCAQRVRLSDGE